LRAKGALTNLQDIVIRQSKVTGKRKEDERWFSKSW
jgi:hypothetical protein